MYIEYKEKQSQNSRFNLVTIIFSLYFNDINFIHYTQQSLYENGELLRLTHKFK